MTQTVRINCMKCRHFYVTWDPKFPKGCKAYGFKTQGLPSQTVLASSGKPCYQFEEKPTKP
ncbi:uracil-DNA glycosylase [Paenibacillus ginsengarvi]|uniref:Uracil-DNA glycosylase n=2 Tax=Paenibacillus ginsengarvi TaxID=400777 RepID=A0A3B0CHW4_9BACL|nr:uracil-DNA glycosylase [Paenibacillus ginsengarvi]RKN84328.1 uracil-DNA glycosylase [Paenibacillus ginsengarvi]